MRCHKHPNSDAVGTCLDCWVWLCQECVQAFSIPVCQKCNLVRFSNEKDTINSTFLKNTIIWIFVGLYLYTHAASQQLASLNGNGNNGILLFAIINAYFGFFVAYGWTFINSMSNPNTITVRVNEWFIALLIRKAFKIVFAVLIGGFVGPYQVWKMKKRLGTIDETVNFIKSNA